MVALYILKTFNDWLDASFTNLLELFYDMLPMNNVSYEHIEQTINFDVV